MLTDAKVLPIHTILIRGDIYVQYSLFTKPTPLQRYFMGFVLILYLKLKYSKIDSHVVFLIVMFNLLTVLLLMLWRLSSLVSSKSAWQLLSEYPGN